MSKIFNISNLYVFIWLLYNFHWNDVGQMFPVLEGISSILLAINLGISLICTLIVITTYPSNSFFRSTNVVLSLFIIYGLIHLLFDSDIRNIDKGSYLIGVLRTFLPIYTFYLFTKLGYLTEQGIKWWFWLFLLNTIIIYFSFRSILEVDEMYELRTNNRAYLLVSLFPFIYFFKEKPWIQYILISLFVTLTVFSIKRGAILTIMLGVFYFFFEKFGNVSNKRKAIVFCVFLILVFIESQIVEVLYNESYIFQKRVSDTLEGDTSNRNLIVSNLLNKFFEGDLFSLIFGFGADATLKEGLFAHNDWVEVLYNQGVVGFLAYFSFWFVWARIWLRQKSAHKELTLLMGLLLFCNFPKTLFSMWYSNANLFVTLPLGYCLANIYLKRKWKRSTSIC